MPEIFDLREVSYRYDQGVTALDRVTLQIHQGERIALLGANGSGKSTLLRILDALYFAESGTVSFNGSVLSEALLRDDAFRFVFRSRVGLVFQNADVQLFNPTVFDEVAFGPLQLRLSKDEIPRRVMQALESMGIAHLKDRAPHRLSGGEKKRVALASVLVMEPQVVLLDEPTSGLDPRSQSQIIDLLQNYSDKKTVITATHDLNMVEDIADHCYILEQGRIVSSGATTDILQDLPLLERTNLIHAHRHRHGSLVHTHPHQHGHGQHEH
ncbi:MAG TPA: ABC transporter ATP-binding protein [Terriglobales bacterium]|nr:ABC transporter ATP-binding protein [Terriglobales bacterium]